MDEGDFRPISLTSCLSKVLEDFVLTWLIDHVKDKVNPNQFGCLKGTSTTACDRIGYNVLIEKLLDLGVSTS